MNESYPDILYPDRLVSVLTPIRNDIYHSTTNYAINAKFSFFLVQPAKVVKNFHHHRVKCLEAGLVGVWNTVRDENRKHGSALSVVKGMKTYPCNQFINYHFILHVKICYNFWQTFVHNQRLYRTDAIYYMYFSFSRFIFIFQTFNCDVTFCDVDKFV